jgi:pimeloyl-ACP methyl ester carboxylesterase
VVVAAAVALALAATSAEASPIGVEASRPTAVVPPTEVVGRNALPAAPTTTTPRVWTARRITAGGVRQWIQCAGHGPVTVVVIAGLHADHRMWSLVLPSFAVATRTCIYDRPGLGSSPSRPRHGIVTAGQHADELWALLQAAGERGPYVVVGHSYGGLIARAFTARHLTRVRGLLLIEGVGSDDQTSHYWGEGGDLVNTWRSRTQAAALRLGSTRLVVEAAQDPNRSYWGGPSYNETRAELAQWRQHQLEASYLSTQSTYLVARHSAHVIEHDNPAAVIAGVRLLVRSIEKHTRLPRCALGAYGDQPRC